MGASENDALTDSEKIRLTELAEQLGAALAKRECILITGATTGLPDLVAKAFREKGGFALGVSPDVVIIFGGATGTLNELTIAYDEGKVIGVLEGSGGVADHTQEIIDFCKKPTRGMVLFDKDPEKLVQRCLAALSEA